MRAGQRKTHRRQRNYAHAPVSIIVRYDMDVGQWMHSPGVVLTARETAVIAALASAEPTKVACRAACCSEKLFDNTVVILKRRFGVQHRIELIAIAQQLFPTELRGRGRSSNRQPSTVHASGAAPLTRPLTL